MLEKRVWIAKQPEVMLMSRAPRKLVACLSHSKPWAKPILLKRQGKSVLGLHPRVHRQLRFVRSRAIRSESPSHQQYAALHERHPYGEASLRQREARAPSGAQVRLFVGLLSWDLLRGVCASHSHSSHATERKRVMKRELPKEQRIDKDRRPGVLLTFPLLCFNPKAGLRRPDRPKFFLQPYVVH
jgi:hypothetical protein